MQKIRYPAIFLKEEKSYTVIFPDLPGCYTCGGDLDTAIDMAEDVLPFYLLTAFEEGEVPPKASTLPFDLKKYDLETQEEISNAEFSQYIYADPETYSKAYQGGSTIEELKVPKWMATICKKHDIKYEDLLYEAFVDNLKWLMDIEDKNRQ